MSTVGILADTLRHAMNQIWGDEWTALTGTQKEKVLKDLLYMWTSESWDALGTLAMVKDYQERIFKGNLAEYVKGL